MNKRRAQEGADLFFFRDLLPLRTSWGRDLSRRFAFRRIVFHRFVLRRYRFLSGLLLALSAPWLFASAAPSRAAASSAPLSGAAPEAAFPWASSFETALEQAQAEQKYVMVDFYTGWCHWCKVLDQTTYADPRVGAVASKLVNVKVNAEVQPNLSQRYGVRGYPTIVFLNPDGSLRTKVVGFKPAEAFVSVLQEVLKNESERYALAQEVLANPRSVDSRQSYAQSLALAGDFRGAASQIDSALMVIPESGNEEMSKEERAGLELDRLVYLHRAGDEPDVRKDLEDWVRHSKSHPRRVEGEFFLARTQERDGKKKDSKKLYQEIAKKQPGSWFAEVARSKLNGRG